MIGEYSIPMHVITTFSLRVDKEDSLPVPSRERRGLGPRGGESPALGLGDLGKTSDTFKFMYVFYLSCPSATFALQCGGFVRRE